MSRHAEVWPLSGVCANCYRDRDDLFRHNRNGKLYCADVFRCEARRELLACRPASPAVTHTGE